MKKINGLNYNLDFFYKDCFYNSLFAILKFYKRDICLVILNEAVYLDICPENLLGMRVVFDRYFPYEQVMDLLGIEVKEYYDLKNLSDILVDNIYNNIPSILKIDCFYEKGRAECFQKLHVDHSVLVHGVNEEDKKYLIFEHNRKDSLIYLEKEITFGDLHECADGYYKNYARNGYPLISCFCRRKDAKVIDLERLHKDCFYKYKDIVNKQYLLLEMVRDKLTNLFCDKCKLEKCNNSLILEINQIIDYYNIQKYKMEVLQRRRAGYRINEIIKKWKFIRLTIFGVVYGQGDVKGKSRLISSLMDDIINFEYEISSDIT